MSTASPFATLGVPSRIVAALAARGVTTPFPIQSATIPDALAGRDILGRGQTGSGKTIAFAVPVVVSLASGNRAPNRPRALVIVPTRELAVQVAETIRPLAQAVGLTCLTVHGGVAQGPQTNALRNGVDIVVATPGRLEDLIAQRKCHLDRVRITVLDEADHMTDLGFLPVVKRLLDQTPADGQRLLFSATLDNAVTALVQRYLRHPAVHSVDAVETSPSRLDHYLFNVQSDHKSAVVADLASGAGRTLLFTRTKHGAKKLAQRLTDAGVPAVELHGNLAQGARQRNLAAFADGSVRVLVATDIAARGIHVDDIALVVHVDPPAEHKAYLHRSGRTARAGAEGAVVTIATPDQASDVKTLFRLAAIQPNAATVGPGDRRTTALTGPMVPRRAPVKRSVAHGTTAPGSRSPKGRSAAPPSRLAKGRPVASGPTKARPVASGPAKARTAAAAKGRRGYDRSPRGVRRSAG